MIKSYIYNNKILKTITIPKGTVLLRGLNFEDENKYTSLFNDLIGYKNDKYYNISPTMNVFFYPVPYMSDAVKIYDVHIMYLTQYDIELLLLINPSNISRSDKDSNEYSDIITTCANISNKDKCGQKMSEVDPCFTDKILKRFPQFDGFICIAAQDAHHIKQKYTKMIKDNNIDRIKKIIPSLLSNSRDIIAIPEIVIHPLHFRYNDCHIITESFYSPKKLVKYCINNRAQYNFFPLLYFTNNHVFTINDLENTDNINNIAHNSRVYNGIKGPKIYENIDNVFSSMLDINKGYNINNTTYKVFIDTRTGFYRVYINQKKLNNKRITYKKIKGNFIDNGFESYLNTYIIKPNNNPTINTIIMSHNKYMDDFIKDLNANGYSIKKKLVLDRGDKNKFINTYHINSVINRPELNSYKNIRRRKNNITRKKLDNNFLSVLKYSGLNMNDLNNIDSIDSIDNNI